MQKLKITDLYLEITRRCNMRCQHCLRGEPQNKTADFYLLDNLFSQISEITTLSFTGGEPSLASGAILAALRAAKKYNTSVHQVYIVTNGKHIPEIFLNAYREWHKYCLQSSIEIPYHLTPEKTKSILHTVSSNERDECGTWIALSMDRFHEEISRENILALATLPHLVTDKYHENTTDWILQEGRALHSFPDGIDPRAQFPWKYNTSNTLQMEMTDDGIYTDELYVSATGLLTKYCDFSYQSQEHHKIEQISCTDYDHTWLNRLVCKSESEI